MAAEHDAVKLQNAAAQAQTQSANLQMALDYFSAMDNLHLRQYGDYVNKTLTDQMLKDQFVDALRVSDIRKDDMLRAFDLSEERYRDQLNINQAEYDRAKDNLDRKFDETLLSFEGQTEDQNLAYQRELDQAAFNQEAINRNKAQALSQYDLQTRQDALSIQRSSDQINQRTGLRNALNTLQTNQLQDEFDLQSRQDALSIQRAHDQLGTRATLRDAATNRQAGLLAQDRADIASQQQEILDTRVQADLIRANQEKAADLEEIRAEINRDSQLANIAFQKQGQRIETLTRTGQAKAKGRQGVSAARTLQTTLALNGINTARLTNLAFFAQRELDTTKQGVALRKEAIGFQDQISKIREAGQLGRLATQGDRLTTQDTYETTTRGAEAAADATASTRLGTQEQLMSDVAANRLSSQQAFNKATFDSETAADTTATTRLATQTTLLSDLALDRLNTQTAEANAQLDQIAYAMGLSAEQLEMNQERLGKSLISAVASIDDQLLALDQAKYKADYNAHATRMLPPEFAPDAKAPYDVPLPKYIEPRPGAAPAPAYQAQYIAPPQQSTLSQALMIGGAALSVAAIPFTLGASIGAASAVAGGASTAAAIGGSSAFIGGTVAGATAIGTTLGSGGMLLGQASNLTYNYR